MIPVGHHIPMAIWAAREIQGHAGRSILLFACLFNLITIPAIPLLFTHALENTWTRLMAEAPHLVIRRIDAGGWAPLPAEQAVYYAQQVPGALRPTPRLWGVAAGPNGPVSVVASAALLPDPALMGVPPPAVGQAVVGRGVLDDGTENRLNLQQHDSLTLDVIGTFPHDSGIVTHDLVWIAPADARRLFGLRPDQASDLAIYLFRREAADTVAADLAAAFPWPVRIVEHGTTLIQHRARVAHTGGTALLVTIPALLALLWLLAGTVLGPAGRQVHWALLRALGWTTADLVRLQVTKAILVGLPAVGAGLAVAYGAISHPVSAALVGYWVMGIQHLPALTLDIGGLTVVLLQITAMVGLPFLLTVFLTTLKRAGRPTHAPLGAEQGY